MPRSIASGALPTNLSQTSSIYKKSSARALEYLHFPPAPSTSAQAVLLVRKGVSMWSCAPPLTFVKSLADRPLTTYKISTQSFKLFPRYGKWGYLHLRGAHVQMDPTHDLCNMHPGLVCNHTSNLVTIGRAIPELWHIGPFWRPSHCARYRSGCPLPPPIRPIRLLSIFLNRSVPQQKPREIGCMVL